MAYVAFSFLAPLWMAFVVGDPPGGLSRSTPLSPNTTLLLAIGVVAFAVGTLTTARTSKAKNLEHDFSGSFLLQAGRILILLPIAISAYEFATGGVANRGMDQVTASASDVFSTLLSPVAIASITMMLIGSQTLKRSRLLAPSDLTLIVILMGLTAARGTRGDVVAMILLLLVAHAHRKGSYRLIIVGIVGILIIGVAVLQYRVEAKGLVSDETASEIILGDLAVAGYTTGATAAAVPERIPYGWGATYAESLIRQLPSLVVNPLIGPPKDMGPRVFRDIVGLESHNQGYGFSIPAEGYLNFGTVGVGASCGVLGLLFGWAYTRTSFTNGRIVGVLYPILLASLPFGLRSDSLGFTKNVLYPLIAVGIVLVIARSISKSKEMRSAKASSRSNRIATSLSE